MSNSKVHEAEQALITALFQEPGELGMRCPSCGHVGSFMIVANMWGMYTEKGHDVDHEDLPDHDHDWDQYASCKCPDCAKEGIVEDFLV